MGNLSTGTLDQIVAQFQTASTSWGAAFATIAIALFWSLFLIEMIVSGIGVLFNRADFGGLASWLVRQLLVMGFFLWVLQNATAFATDIIESLQQIAQQAGAPLMTPSAVFAGGVNVATSVAGQVSILHPADSAGLVICAIVILISFVMICAWMLVTLCEAWVLCGMAALFIAFGALGFARDVAINFLRYALGAGFKLLAMQLLLGIGSSFIQQWGEGAETGSLTFQAIFVMMGVSLTLAALTKMLPDLVQRLITGSAFSVAHYSHLAGSAVGTAAVAATPVIVGIGGVAAAVQAGLYGAQKLAQRDEDGTAPASPLGRLAVGSGAAMQGLGRAVAQDLALGARIGGRTPLRMAQNIRNQRRISEAERARPNPSKQSNP